MKRGILILALCCYAINLFSQTNTNKGFLGIVIGPSIPLNEFVGVGYAESPLNYFAKTGYSSNLITFGYLFNKNFGISSSIFYNQYMIKDKDETTFWGLVGITFGPMISFPIRNKSFIDLKIKSGYVTAQLVIDEFRYKENTGVDYFCIDLRASYRYNFSRYFCFLTEAGYLYTNQKFTYGCPESKRYKVMESIFIGVGLAFNFKLREPYRN